MTRRRGSDGVLLPIAAVERDTGLSKDTLRVWERRYGFPVPERDETGERAYPLEQVERLRLMKRLLDGGHRPGRVVTMADDELQSLARLELGSAETPPTGASAQRADIEACIALIRRHDVAGLKRHFAHLMARVGVGRFVIELIAPLNVAVGDAWLRGRLEVYEEHLYTEVVQIVLRQAIARMPEPTGGRAPQVLLTTLPGEPHGLGLLMVEALLLIEGCRCVALGVQTPVWDTAQAAQALGSDIVALGFTGCMSPNQIVAGLAELREKLPSTTALWVGGSAPVLHRRAIAGVRAVASLAGLGAELQHWRDASGPPLAGAGGRPGTASTAA